MSRERMSGVPLRTQLIVLLLGTVTVVVLGTSLAGAAALRSYLVERIDDQLSASLAQPPRGPRGGAVDRRGPRDVAVSTFRYDQDGRLLTPVGGVPRSSGGPDVTDPRAYFDGPAVVDDIAADRRWRVLSVPDQRTGGSVLAAVAFDGVEDTVRQLLVISSAIGLLAFAATGALGWFAVRRSLRPLVAVEETAQAIAAGDLAVRVPAADRRTEVGSLAASFNVMVDRFQTAYTAQQQSERDARASESRMRQFVADASHELRTPLTSIRGFAELFRQGAASDPKQLAQVMRRIEDEGARMGLLVDDLLLLAHLDQQRPLRQEPVDVLTVAGDVVSAAAAAHGAHHDVVLHADGGDAPPVVLGDSARLHQVLSNLVGNAVAHTAPGTRVEVRVQRTGGVVTIEVCDDGAGMQPEVAARVFERFYRADSSRTRVAASTTGSGLGLSIVAALVSAHGGEVAVVSEPGAGARFTVELPAERG